MKTTPDTRVTYFRTSLDPLDIYRLNDIITNHGSDDTSTPAAALVTHLREINPDLRWNTKDLVDTMSDGFGTNAAGIVDVSGKVLLDAVSFETEGSSNCFMALRRVYDFAAISRSIWFTSVTSHAPSNLPRATTTGIVAAGDPRRVPVSDDSTAAEIARMTGPIGVDVSISLHSSPTTGAQPVTEVDPQVPAGFTPIGWDDKTWRDPNLQTPGRDFTADVARSAPCALVSAVAQGEGHTPVVVVNLHH